MMEFTGKQFNRDVKAKKRELLKVFRKDLTKKATISLLAEVLDHSMIFNTWGELSIRFKEGKVVGVEERKVQNPPF